MKYLGDNYGKKMLSGQYTNHNYTTEIDAIFEATGKYPAVRGCDFLYYSPSRGYKGIDTDLAIEWSKKGGLVSFSWHWYAPLEESEFYTEKTTFDLSKAVTQLDVANIPLDEIEKLYNDGAVSKECYYIVRDIDVISDELKKLQENNVTVLWRPLHEASGGWFWWGSKGAENFIWLWKLMVDRQTKFHELNNLIWVWNGQNDSWYAGDEYCDIIGDDVYAEKQCYETQAERFIGSVNCSGNKIVALSENGVMIDPDLMEADGVYWSWFNTWCREFIVGKDRKLDGTHTSIDMINKVYNHDLIITLDELPDFNI